jgi:hypothetical protein
MLKRRIKQHYQEEWANEWTNEARGRTTYSLTPKPTQEISWLHTLLYEPLSSVLIQLWTEKIGFRYFLFHRHVREVTDAACDCGRGEQTVRHVLVACPTHHNLRKETWEKEDRRRPIMDLKEVLNTPNLSKKAARFMIATRLGQYGAVKENEI